MATGRQASLYPENTNQTLLYTCPANKTAVATLRICNQDDEEITAWAWLSHGTPDEADCIEPGAPIQPASVLEDSGLIMGAGDTIYVKADATGLNFIVWALEETAS